MMYHVRLTIRRIYDFLWLLERTSTDEETIRIGIRLAWDLAGSYAKLKVQK